MKISSLRYASSAVGILASTILLHAQAPSGAPAAPAGAAAQEQPAGRGGRGNAPQPAGAQGRGAGAAGRGGGGGGAAVVGFGTTNTLYTIPERARAAPPTIRLPSSSRCLPKRRPSSSTQRRWPVPIWRVRSRFCTWNASAKVPPGNSPETVQVFDNVYLATTGSVSAWIIRTSAGIIFWDTLNSEAEAKDIIEAGMRNSA